MGHHTGNRCDHSYRLRLPVGRRSVSLRITETYYLIDDHNLLYRAHLSKWGLPVGTIFAAFRRS